MEVPVKKIGMWLFVVIFVVAVSLSACNRPYPAQAVPSEDGPAYLLVSADGQAIFGEVFILKGGTTCVIVTSLDKLDRSCVHLVLMEKHFDVPVNQDLFPLMSFQSSGGTVDLRMYVLELGRAVVCNITVGGEVDIECLKN
jgi:hypothetical protein